MKHSRSSRNARSTWLSRHHVRSTASRGNTSSMWTSRPTCTIRSRVLCSTISRRRPSFSKYLGATRKDVMPAIPRSVARRNPDRISRGGTGPPAPTELLQGTHVGHRGVRWKDACGVDLFVAAVESLTGLGLSEGRPRRQRRGTLQKNGVVCPEFPQRI